MSAETFFTKHKLQKTVIGEGKLESLRVTCFYVTAYTLHQLLLNFQTTKTILAAKQIYTKEQRWCDTYEKNGA